MPSLDGESEKENYIFVERFVVFRERVPLPFTNLYILITSPRCVYTVKLQWLEHRLLCHGYFELVLESLGKHPIATDIIIFGMIKGDILFILKMVCCV